MQNTKPSNGAPSLQSPLLKKPELLLLAFFLAPLPLFPAVGRTLRNAMASEAVFEIFAPSVMASCLVVSLVIAVAGSGRPLLPHRRKQACLLSLLYPFSLGALWFASLVHTPVQDFLVGIGLLCGTGIAIGGLAWLPFYSLDIRNATFYGGLCCGIMAIVAMLTALMPAPLNAMVTVTCATAGSVSPFLFRRLGRLPARTGEVEGPKETTGLLSALKSLLTVDWLFLLGLLVCLFISVADEQGDATATAFQPELVGCITASVAAVVLCLAHGHTPLSLLIGRLVIPCLVAFLVLMSGFPEGSSLFSFSAFIVYAPYMLLSLFALASLAATSASGELPPAFVYGVTLALCTVVLLLGFICHHAIASQTDLRIMLRSIIFCYFAIVIVQLAYASWRQLYGRGALSDDEEPSGTDAIAALRQPRIEELAQRGSLTAREREILGYLSYGHGSAFIAKSLFITDNTARTHIRNIYRKLGLSSREELLALFNPNN